MTKTVCTCNYCKKEIVGEINKVKGEFRFSSGSDLGFKHKLDLDFCDEACLNHYMKEIFPTLEWEGDI